MKKSISKIITLAILVLIFTGFQITAVHATGATPGYNYKILESIMTPNKVESSIDELNYYDGLYQSDTTSRR
jgi:hypothetical protein